MNMSITYERYFQIEETLGKVASIQNETIWRLLNERKLCFVGNYFSWRLLCMGLLCKKATFFGGNFEKATLLRHYFVRGSILRGYFVGRQFLMKAILHWILDRQFCERLLCIKQILHYSFCIWRLFCDKLFCD